MSLKELNVNSLASLVCFLVTPSGCFFLCCGEGNPALDFDT